MIVEIDNYLVSTEILSEHFCCDYQKCKGCCCIIGDSGAPLLSSEERLIRQSYEQYRPFLSKKGAMVIEKEGYSIVDTDGDIVTPLVNQKGECAYSYTTSEGYTFCAIEKGYEMALHNSKESKENSDIETVISKFRKPISCWLFPIRVSVLSNGYISLVLSREHLCKEAFIKGEKEKIPVYQFLKEPIIHRFGNDFYEKLEQIAKELKAAPKQFR